MGGATKGEAPSTSRMQSAAAPGDNPPVAAYVPGGGRKWSASAATWAADGTAATAVDPTAAGKGVPRGTACGATTVCVAGTACAAAPGGGGGVAAHGTRCRAPAPPCGRCDNARTTCLEKMVCGVKGMCLPVKTSEQRPELCAPAPRGRSGERTPEREAELRERYGRPNEYRWAYYWTLWDAYVRSGSGGRR